MPSLSPVNQSPLLRTPGVIDGELDFLSGSENLLKRDGEALSVVLPRQLALLVVINALDFKARKVKVHPQEVFVTRDESNPRRGLEATRLGKHLEVDRIVLDVDRGWTRDLRTSNGQIDADRNGRGRIRVPVEVTGTEKGE